MNRPVKKVSLLASLVLGGLSNLTFAADCVNGVNLATCTVPAGVTSMKIEAWGGGGAGASGEAMMDGNGGGGGGGGSYCGSTFTVTPGSTLTVNIGTGGAAAASGQGVPGGQTTVTGPGVAGLAANGGSAGYLPAGGLGGTIDACVTNGAARFAGGAGANGDSNPMGSTYGGGGGGSATALGAGGAGVLMAGGGGEGGGGMGADIAQNSAALPGTAPGGGGGGRAEAMGLDNGANGADGRVVMTFVIPAASPASIPTLSEWGMIILSSLLALGAAFTLRRQRR